MPTNLYGPGDNYHPTNSHVMAAFIRKFLIAKKDLNHKVTCWGTGKALREFLHVYDLASAIIFALEYWSPNDKNAPKDSNGNPLFVLNVGSGEEISIKDLSNKVAKASLYEGEIEWDLSKPDGTPRKKLDISRLSKMGWNAKIKLDIGIEQTISEQYKNNNFQ